MRVSTETEIDLRGMERKLGERSMNLGRLAYANQALADMNSFVPLESSMLRQTGHVVDEGRALEWRTPYALAQFHGSRPFRRGMPVNIFMVNFTTPGTGPRWDLEAKSRHGQDWTKAFVRGSYL